MQVSPSPVPFSGARRPAGWFRRGLPLVAAGLVLAGVLAAPSASFAHALLTAPKPRDNRDDHKDNNGGAPCGIARATTQPTTNPPLTPGASFMVTWNETVNHPGCFVIDFAMANDTSFQVLSTVAHKTTGNTPRMYSQMVTLPSTPCAACTLRLRQIMLSAEPAAGAACPPANLATNSTYYTCANVVLGGGSGDGGVPDGGGTATGGAGGGGAGATGGRGGATGGTPGTGTGGGVTSSGGATGTGGAITSSGGRPGTGGAVTSSGGAANPGSGGAANPGSGGAANPGSGGAGAGEQPADPPPCACGVTNARTMSISGLLFAAMVAMTLGRARARRRSAFTRNTNDNQ